MFGSNRDFYHTGLQIGRSDLQAMVNGMGPGDHFFVDYRNGSDNNDGKTWAKAFRTYSKAVDAVVSNHNDIIHIAGDSTVVETAMVTLSKNRVHTVGHNGALGHYGAGAKIDCTLAAGSSNIATFKNTGVRNTFTGVKFTNSSTVAAGLYAGWEAGEYARYFNCEMQKLTDLDEALAADLLLQGDSPQFYNCCIGVSSLSTVGAIVRPNVLLTTVQSKDVLFENCIFPKQAGNAAAQMINLIGNVVDRFLLFKDCIFINDALAAADPDHAIGATAAQTNGSVLLKNCTSVHCTVMAEAAVNIYVDGAVPLFATSGVSVAAA